MKEGNVLAPMYKFNFEWENRITEAALLNKHPRRPLGGRNPPKI